MDADLKPVYDRITEASRPEDVFGAQEVVLSPQRLLAYLEREWSVLKALTHPKDGYRHPEDAEAASFADQLLDSFYEEGQRLIREGIYGIEGYDTVRPPHSKSFSVGSNTYYIGLRNHAGDIATYYEGFLERQGVSVGEVVIKLANEPDCNQLLQNELRALDVLHGNDVPQWKHLPFVMDKFESGGKLGIIFRKIRGYSLRQIRQHHLHHDGLDQRHMVWILDRILSCLGYIHRCGLVHGGINPDHIMVRTSDHNSFIVDFSRSVYKPAVTGEKIKHCVDDGFTAPEVLDMGKIGPWSDMYSVGKLMIWLLGGNQETNEIPSAVEGALQDFLRRLVQESQYARPSDAWTLYEEQNDIKDSLWKRTFLHLEMG